jgi:hypothetical protein
MPPASPLEAAQEAGPYMLGLMDGLSAAGDDWTPALRRRLTDLVCGSKLSEAELISVGSFGRAFPSTIDATMLECAFSGNQKEGPVLWALMDAWRETGLPIPDSLAELKGTAKDSNTLRRFMSLEEERVMRLQQATGLASRTDNATNDLAGRVLMAKP